MGRRNTRRKSQVHEFRLRIICEHKSKEKASCLGKSELQPKGSVRLKRIARSIDQRSVASTGLLMEGPSLAEEVELRISLPEGIRLLWLYWSWFVFEARQVYVGASRMTEVESPTRSGPHRETRYSKSLLELPFFKQTPRV